MRFSIDFEMDDKVFIAIVVALLVMAVSNDFFDYMISQLKVLNAALP